MAKTPLELKLKAQAEQATKKKFANRLASEDQRNGYLVGYYDALLFKHRERRQSSS